jgi:hypothetical protein
MAARLEDDTLKLGLLMEAAQAQQTLASSALERLHQHTAGLDAIVREEIRATIVEEMHALAEDTRRASEALRGLGRAADRKLTVWSATILALSIVVPCALAQWWFPSPAEVAALAARREQLNGDLARLTSQGGRIELHHCGSAQRLCVRIDRSAPPYGEAADFRVVKGY